jgi:hypothetical protein
MPDTKSILGSRTIWSNLVGLLALMLALGGRAIGVEEQGQLVEAILQTVAGASFVASTLFRVLAEHKLR